MSFDCSRYQLPSSNSIAGYELCPVPAITSVRLLRLGHGPLTTSYSTPWSSSAFCTFQHGCPPNFAHIVGHRCSLTGIESLPSLADPAIIPPGGHLGSKCHVQGL